jgi:hypothetical protein
MSGLLAEKLKCKQMVSFTVRRGLGTMELACDLHAVCNRNLAEKKKEQCLLTTQQ